MNLLALPVTILWVWASYSLHLSSPFFLTVLFLWVGLCGFFACLMVESFEQDTWLAVFVEVIGVYYWISSLVKLTRVVRGKAEFPELTS